MNTLTEIWGAPSSGKTHTAYAGWPDPLLLDTAFTSMGFRDMEVEEAPDEKGESWSTVLKLNDFDHEAAEESYHYLAEWPESFHFPGDHDTIIIDNAADLRVLAANHWCEQNDSDWPRQAEWGAVNDMLDKFFRELKNNYHVVVISQMKDEYVNDAKTGKKTRDGPKRMDYKADFRLFLEVDEGERHAYVRKNRFMDPASDEYGAEGSDLGDDVTLEDLMLFSGVPDSEW